MIFRGLMLASVASLSAGALVWAGTAEAREPELPETVKVWPKVKSPVGIDPVVEARIDEIMAQMTDEHKVGQIIQPEIKNISFQEVRDYHIGSVLNGGGSYPGEDAYGEKALWVAAANKFYEASMDTSKGGLPIPVIWGTDAVHGHNNVVGATLFPHNIGLGAANNPGLMRDIGVVTAREVASTGIDWTFAPTIAVARDERWGRTYESFSEDPAIVAELGKEMILGLQGHPALDNFLTQEKLVATAKHFVGDGGTTKGDDQGNTEVSEEELALVHGAGYSQTLGVGAQTVMASFNSWNGDKLHGNKYLLTDVLKGRMGFDGFVVGDWNGHEQIPGCTASSCPEAINAGVDLIMVPLEWKGFYKNTLRQVRNGEISQERLDDAVRRILRVKIRAGLFDHGKPSDHVLAGRFALIGNPQHREVARQAVRESLVLLKNEDVLPLASNSKILVAGSGADNLVMQAGGWSVTWQGRDNKQTDFPGATSIETGIREAVAAGDGYVTNDANEGDVDAAVVVFGETPYAEFEGDLEDLEFKLDDNADFQLVQELKSKDIPVVVVFLTGRPRWVNDMIDLADAFVVAWLPGSEAGGVADVLIGDPEGNVRNDFKGKLSFSWPARPDQVPLNVGDADYDPLYPFGYGLTYTD